MPGIRFISNTWRWPSKKPIAAAADDEVPVGAVIVSPKRGVLAPGPQSTGTVARSNRPCRNDRTNAGGPSPSAPGGSMSVGCMSLLEPCPMCAGAIVQARIPVVVYGAADPKAGACHTLYQITNDPAAQSPRPSDLRRDGASVCRIALRVLCRQTPPWQEVNDRCDRHSQPGIIDGFAKVGVYLIRSMLDWPNFVLVKMRHTR